MLILFTGQLTEARGTPGSTTRAGKRRCQHAPGAQPSLPDLQLAAFYQGSGVGGNANFAGLSTRGGVGASLNQLFTLGFPGYGASLTLSLPIKNRAAHADLGAALVTRHRDPYLSQQVREQITLDVSNAVHKLEEVKMTVAAGKTALDLKVIAEVSLR